MNYKYLYIILFAILATSIQAQQVGLDDSIMKGYIVDGQMYTLTISDGITGKAYLTMFNGFDYRLHISSKSIKNYKISLFDIEKKMLFSNSCENYETINDIRFQSNLTGYIQIDVIGEQNNLKDKVFNITIGFKESKDKK